LQVAVCLVLLTATALFARSLWNLQSFAPGFKSENVFVMQLGPQPGGYKNVHLKSYYRDLLQEVGSLPGVKSASLSSWTPLMDPEVKEEVKVDGSSVASEGMLVDVCPIGPNFLATLGTPLLRGRDFGQQDTAESPKVAIISDSLGRALFPSEDPIGRRISVGRSPEQQGMQIIGVARDATYRDFRQRTTLAVYVPYLQEAAASWGYPTLEVRTVGHPIKFAAALRSRVTGLGREVPLLSTTLTELVDRSLVRERMTATLSAFFAFMALVLASIGLYGLIAYSVTRRTSEIGIRMALGAGTRNVLWLVLRRTVILVSAGIGLGLTSALAVGWLVSGLLFGIRARDPVSFAAAAVAVTIVAFLASYLPVRRALSIDPTLTLRYE
jgi:predicted permease